MRTISGQELAYAMETKEPKDLDLSVIKGIFDCTHVVT